MPIRRRPRIMEYYERDFDGNKRTFILHYSQLKEDYICIKNYSNEEFLNNISEILHTTCIICHFKEIPAYNLIGDCGIIHELIHILNNVETCHYSLDKIRKMWEYQCRL